MRVAVDLVFLTGTKGGMETYARELFPAMASLGGVQFVGLVNREARKRPIDWFPGPTISLPVSGENRLAWAFGEACLVGERARRIGADLLHCPANLGPVTRWLPTVLTIHDLLAFRFPELVSRGYATGVRTLVTGAARGADRILTDSRASAADVLAHLPVDPTALDVVPLGVRGPDNAQRAAAQQLARLGIDLSRQFALSTGNRLPHKNFPGLLNAWAQLPTSERPLLVITGSHGDDPLCKEVAARGLDRDVHLLGWVDAADLDALHTAAALYVSPSLFEGFGLPVLEAMRRGTPVVCSDIPVLHEVGGNAVVYADSRDPKALADAVRQVATDVNLQATLRDAGLARSDTFTWDRTALLTLEAYERTIRGARKQRPAAT